MTRNLAEEFEACAKSLGLSPAALARKMERGETPTAPGAGGWPYLERAALDAWLARREARRESLRAMIEWSEAEEGKPPVRNDG